MILCWRHPYWFLAGFSSDPQWRDRFSLRLGFFMYRDPALEWRAVNNYLYSVLDRSVAMEYTFYPEIRYKGMRVTPVGWDPKSEEPMLRCELHDLGERGRQGFETRRRAVEELRADGWRFDDREGGWKFVHVDELEKVEGPPPDVACW